MAGHHNDDLFNERGGPVDVSRDKQARDRGSRAQDSEAKCFAAAVRLLAGREYSIKELSTKLARRFPPDAVANVVAEMQSQGYVSDARYGEAFCRSRIAHGYGRMFIARELAQNGLDSDLIEALLLPHEDRWLEYAIALVEKRTSKGQSQGTLLDHRSGAGDSPDHAECLEFDEAGSADLRREAWQRDQKERARLARFLARRGFSGAIASRAINIGMAGCEQIDD